MATPRSRATRLGSETRVAILDAAERVFAEKGFLGASLRDIVSQIGIAKPSLIHHFPNKGRLYAAVLDRIADSLRPPIEDCRNDPDPAAALIGFAHALNAWSERYPRGYRIVLRDMLDLAYRSPKPHQWPLTFVVETIRKSFARLNKRGPLGTLTFEAFLATYLGAIFYAHLSRDTLSAMPYPERPRDWSRQAAVGVSLLLEWLIDPQRPTK